MLSDLPLHVIDSVLAGSDCNQYSVETCTAAVVCPVPNFPGPPLHMVARGTSLGIQELNERYVINQFVSWIILVIYTCALNSLSL